MNIASSSLSDIIIRCPWADTVPLMKAYHDDEWGVPIHDDRALFEFLVLEGAQAGLNWSTILARRARYREVFDGFDPEMVALYGPEKTALLLADHGIVRNRLKIVAAVENARAFLRVREEFGTFDRYIWRFTGGATIRNAWTAMKDIPAETLESQAMSRDLKSRGFRFAGPTICYAFMQAVGIVNDHIVTCFRYGELLGGL